MLARAYPASRFTGFDFAQGGHCHRPRRGPGVGILRIEDRFLPGRALKLMAWSSTSVAARYQHVTDPIRREVAGRVNGLLCDRGMMTAGQLRPKLRPRPNSQPEVESDELPSPLARPAEDAGFEPARA